MAHLVVMERGRWLELSKPDKRQDRQKVVMSRMNIMDQPISQQGLFNGVIASMTDKYEEQKKQGEALNMYLPTGAAQPSTQSAARGQPGHARPFQGQPGPAYRGGLQGRGAGRGGGRGDGRRKYPSASPARSHQPPRGGFRGANKKPRGT